MVECRRQNDFGAELEYFSFNGDGDPSSDSHSCGRKLMVDSGSFWSFGSLDGLSGRYCNISFMVGIVVEEHGKHQEIGTRRLQTLSLGILPLFPF